MDSSSEGAAKPSDADMNHSESPGCLGGTSPPKGQDEEEEDEEERRVDAGHRTKRERRQVSGSGGATVCQVCNIQLNSSAQAQIHYKGKTHQRRLRRLAKAVSAGALSQSQVHPLLGSLPLPARAFQPQAHTQLEHFLPLRLNGSSPLSLFPNFNTMDPVQKAVINHTFGMAPPKKKAIISCNICHLRFNSTTQAEAHYKGHKHARKLKALETQRNRHKSGHGPSTSGKERGRERGIGGEETVPTDSQLKEKKGPSTSSRPEQRPLENGQGTSPAPPPASQATSTESYPSLRSSQPPPQIGPGSQPCHQPSDSPSVEGCSSAPQPDPQGGSTGGSKHKQMLDGHSSSSSSSQPQRRVRATAPPRAPCRLKQRKGSKTRAAAGASNQPFHCELCQVSVNSETQLKQHMNSRRHKERLAGKPVKAKFTPYNKLQPSAVLATKLALQKQLSKALPAGFLSGPINPAALCTMASGPLALQLPHGPAAIIQGPLISPTLFRPAPGPLRATHAPIIFSPY
ncbi:zinc finger protein 385B-like isoform X2 [Betta splendens]|uniref:Zinc finger protein 385B-like isoform X2 n=1 Tax=Betta splendens TaxID=158456 RepID=A0A6P7L517_BETSP|nr:zinc finger protein 385B-like isoform X2 [Betta splendens]